MSKRPFLILSLVVSILTLLYLILHRQGIIRKWQLQIYQPEDYLRKFAKIPKADKTKVVVAFSISEKLNLEQIKPFLNSLLDQTVKVDEIILNIPYKDMEIIPKRYKKILSVHGYSKDYENAANLICSVLTEPEANTKIVLVEPNTMYNDDFIEMMVAKSNEQPDKIVYGNKDKNIKHGILLKPKFFDNKISDYQKGKGCCPWLDECTNVGAVYL